MKSLNWRLVAELVGLTAVFVSLLVVVFELRQNTSALRGSTLYAVTEQKQFELHWGSEIAPIQVKP